jgi:hypothetical protein
MTGFVVIHANEDFSRFGDFSTPLFFHCAGAIRSQDRNLGTGDLTSGSSLRVARVLDPLIQDDLKGDAVQGRLGQVDRVR